MLEGFLRDHAGKSLLLDSNVLLAYLVGLDNPGRVETHKRTRAYRAEDWELIAALAAHFRGLRTTPHVLTEVSNLLGHASRRPDRRHGSSMAPLVEFLEVADERHLPALEVRDDARLTRLGLTDTMVVLAARERCVVVTDDLALYVACQTGQVPVLNINHLREWG